MTQKQLDGKNSIYNNLKNCFSSAPVNSGRQPELDLAKGFAILFMIWVHVFEELSPGSNTLLVTIVEVLGGPFAAPVFMVCLGVGISYSKHNIAKALARRGISLLGIGLLLNVFRYILPDLIQYTVTGENEYLYAAFSLFSVDILQFAGLAFLFLALVKKLKVKYTLLFLIGTAASILGMVLRGMTTGSYVIDQFAGFIWGTATETYFPFLNWIIFPIFGLIFGSLLKRCKDKKTFYLHVSPFSATIMLIYLFLTIKYGLMFSSGGTYYFMGTIDALFFLILSLFIFGFCYAILHLFKRISFHSLLRWSKHINTIYCIHWTILGLLKVVQQFIFKMNRLSFWLGTLTAVILLVISDLLSLFYVNYLKPKFIKKMEVHHEK